jgi:hypothetical protein
MWNVCMMMWNYIIYDMEFDFLLTWFWGGVDYALTWKVIVQ